VQQTNSRHFSAAVLTATLHHRYFLQNATDQARSVNSSAAAAVTDAKFGYHAARSVTLRNCKPILHVSDESTLLPVSGDVSRSAGLHYIRLHKRTPGLQSGRSVARWVGQTTDGQWSGLLVAQSSQFNEASPPG